jgi:hypothetical protein
MTTTTQWNIDAFFTNDEKERRANVCSCKDIIYNDVEKWFMEDLAFKSLYTSCKERPDLQENKLTKDSNVKNNNFMRVVKKILDTYHRIGTAAVHGNREDTCYFPETRDWFQCPCETEIDIYDVSTEDLKNGFDPDTNTPSNYEDFYLYTESCDTSPGFTYLVKSSIVSFLFNTLTKKEFIGYTLDMMLLFPTFEKTLTEKIVGFKEQKIFTSQWKGSNYYYKKLFLKPIYFHEMEIPREILCFRNYTCFDDMICGHPKASHGWAFESLQELINLNLISF